MTVPLKRKSQSALEYLMTYGWGLVVVGVVIAALALLYVNPAGTAGNMSGFAGTGITVLNSSYPTTATGPLSLIVSNQSGRQLTLVDNAAILIVNNGQPIAGTLTSALGAPPIILKPGVQTTLTFTPNFSWPNGQLKLDVSITAKDPDLFNKVSTGKINFTITSGATPPAQLCGNGNIDAGNGELCDPGDGGAIPANLNGHTCNTSSIPGVTASLHPSSSGTPLCNSTCDGFLAGTCERCGDNSINGSEFCDGTSPPSISSTCDNYFGFNGNYGSAALSECNNRCDGFDSAACTCTPTPASTNQNTFQACGWFDDGCGGIVQLACAMGQTCAGFSVAGSTGLLPQGTCRASTNASCVDACTASGQYCDPTLMNRISVCSRSAPTDCLVTGSAQICIDPHYCQGTPGSGAPYFCTTDSTPLCGNGTCNATETFASCPADCHCGNGTIESSYGETCDTANLGSNTCDSEDYAGNYWGSIYSSMGHLICDPISCQFDSTSVDPYAFCCANECPIEGQHCCGDNCANSGFTDNVWFVSDSVPSAGMASLAAYTKLDGSVGWLVSANKYVCQETAPGWCLSPVDTGTDC